MNPRPALHPMVLGTLPGAPYFIKHPAPVMPEKLEQNFENSAVFYTPYLPGNKQNTIFKIVPFRNGFKIFYCEV